MSPLELIAAGSILLALACALWVALDVARNPQPMWIMNLVWPLTALYAGPLGVWAYRTVGRDTTDPDGQPAWRSVLKGATHCGAGCTVGDFAAEWTVFLSGVTLLGSELLATFTAAFIAAYVVGVFFQYFSIAPMRGLGLRDGLIAAVKADTLSLAAYEVGMFAWMALVRLVLLPDVDPTRWTYWFMMQIAMLLGLATTWPVNVWLIRKGLKEAM